MYYITRNKEILISGIDDKPRKASTIKEAKATVNRLTQINKLAGFSDKYGYRKVSK